MLDSLQNLTVQKVLQRWPETSGLLYFGGRQSSWHIFALSYSEVEPDNFFKIQLTQLGRTQTPYPFECGYIGLLSYDKFATPDEPDALEHRVFYVYSALLINADTGEVILTRSEDSHLGDHIIPLEALRQKTESLAETPSNPEISANSSDSAYLKLATTACADILRGQYYQINLLRYFQLNQKLPWQHCCQLLTENGGPFAAYFRIADFELLSLSPERFVSFGPSEKGLIAETFPIKGTCERFADPVADEKQKLNLLASVKDQAELAMIIDLMRNDFNRISEPGSVEVVSSGALETFANVHHLVGQVRSTLDMTLSMGELLSCLCPAGSITGAPKVEVMRHISAMEDRQRGYFMGNIFYLDVAQGRFDSSVLIRTLVTRGDQSPEVGVGSGIVVKSSPQSELAEINAKLRILEL